MHTYALPSLPICRYLGKVNVAMQNLKKSVEGAPITILTHSVGRWALLKGRASANELLLIP